MGVDTKWLAKQQETRMSDDLVTWFKEANGFAQGTKAPHKWVLQAEQELRFQARRIVELIAERDEAWKRAAHSEKMWGEAEVKLLESEALLAKAVEWTEKVQKYAISWDDKYLAERSNEILAELTGEQK